MAKRIQMRKNRFQKIAESMKAARENPGPPGLPGDHGDHVPKQTVSNAALVTRPESSITIIYEEIELKIILFMNIKQFFI